MVHVEDIIYIKELDQPNVWIGHFHQVGFGVGVDFRTKNFHISGIILDKIKVLQDYDTGKRSRVSPPRPSVTQNMMRNSNLIL
jgi:hypothetical protein